MKLIECVPNFSEGRDRSVIDALAEAISAVEGVKLLEVDPGADTNRTVFTFVGPPAAVGEAAFRSIKVATERIDMRRHRGAHPRLGACDVCPLVPLQGVEMKDCIRLARALGRRVAEELGVPVYLYGQAAQRPERRELAEVRRGEYESLPRRLGDPYWQPDFGSLDGCQKTGATIVGAREFLIAINFNLNVFDRALAQDIACQIRQSGRIRRDRRGRIMRDKEGKPLRKPGLFRAVQAVGWVLPEKRLAQVSVNLTDFHTTPLAELFLEICRQAEQRGARCTGSELVGLMPRECLLEAGRFFLRRAGKSPALAEGQIVEAAVRSLGLSDLAPFDVQRRIIEYRIAEARPLANGSLRQFADAVSNDSPAPGGGSVAAVFGTLAAALAAMVANLTYGRAAWRNYWPEMQKVAEEAQRLKQMLLEAVDDDTRAFQGVISARRLPAASPEEKRNKEQALQAAVVRAIEVPLGVVRTVAKLLPLLEKALRHGNPQTVTDAGVAIYGVQAAAAGAALNVLINVADLGDRRLAAQKRKLVQSLLASVRRRTGRLERLVGSRLRG